MNLLKYTSTVTLLLVNLFAFSQKDTLPPINQTIKVKATFKPELITFSKQGITPSVPQPDTSIVQLQYSVPAQNLFITYLPISIQPLAMQQPAYKPWGNSNYIKVGYGNYQSPYVQAMVSLGNGTTSNTVLQGNYQSAKGTLQHQQYRTLQLQVNNHTKADKFTLNTAVNYNYNIINMYGYNNALFNLPKQQVQQQYQTIQASTTLANSNNPNGISYQPNAHVTYFSNRDSASELSAILNIPFQKKLNDNISIALQASADATILKTITNSTNTIVYLQPALQYAKNGTIATLGASPTWSNGTLTILPNVQLHVPLSNSSMAAKLGWQGSYTKGTYHNWVQVNPYIQRPSTLFNTLNNVVFAGLTTTTSKVTVAIGAAYIRHRNIALYTNDTFTGRSFIVRNEPLVNNMQITAEFTFINKETLSWHTTVALNNYFKVQQNNKAYGLLPLQVTSNLQWQVHNSVTLTASAFVWNGAPYLNKAKQVKQLPFVADINAGIDFAITKPLHVWVQANNLANTRYQRWNQYETFGFNILGGVRYNFGALQ